MADAPRAKKSPRCVDAQPRSKETKTTDDLGRLRNWGREVKPWLPAWGWPRWVGIRWEAAK